MGLRAGGSSRCTCLVAALSAARNELNASVRTELVRKSRYLHKNSGFVRELVANMSIYSTKWCCWPWRSTR